MSSKVLQQTWVPFAGLREESQLLWVKIPFPEGDEFLGSFGKGAAATTSCQHPAPLALLLISCPPAFPAKFSEDTLLFWGPSFGSSLSPLNHWLWRTAASRFAVSVSWEVIPRLQNLVLRCRQGDTISRGGGSATTRVLSSQDPSVEHKGPFLSPRRGLQQG